MSLKDNIQKSLIEAMKARNKDRVAIIRFFSAAIKQREIDERKDLDDAEVLAVLDKQAKQRRESIEQYEKGCRDDLAAKEKIELAIIQEFLPEALTDVEIDQLIADAVSQTGAAEVKDMGKVMGILKPQIQGRADMKAVSGKVRSQLA